MSTGASSVTITDWFKSRYSSSTGSCVEVRLGHEAVLIRDTKSHGQGPVLAVPREQWRWFLSDVLTGEDTNPALRITRDEDGQVTLNARGAQSTAQLTYTGSEWAAFLAGVRDGEFTPADMRPVPTAG